MHFTGKAGSNPKAMRILQKFLRPRSGSLQSLQQGWQKAGWYTRLVRGPNLLMMIIIMLLMRYALFLPLYNLAGIELQTPHLTFLLILCSTVFIAAAGYILNDFYDLKIDLLNKPSDRILGRSISATRGLIMVAFFNTLGLILGLAAAMLSGRVKLFFLFLLPVMLLYLYSRHWKRRPLTGNLAVAFLSALLLLIPWLFEVYIRMDHPESWTAFIRYSGFMNTVTGGFTGFAFLTTWIREMIKDMEDLPGDKAEGCRTLPITAGCKTTGRVISGLLVVTMGWLGIAQFWLYKHGYTESFLYYFLVQYMFVRLYQIVPEEYDKEALTHASKWAKLIMLAGILGMATLWAGTGNDSFPV